MDTDLKSKIIEKERELESMKFDLLKQERSARLKKEVEFLKDRKIDVYTSDDYCGMSDGQISFYYGYEVTGCKIHGSGECEGQDCEMSEWCFQATDCNNGRILASYATSELWHRAGEKPYLYLLAGIARGMQDGLW